MKKTKLCLAWLPYQSLEAVVKPCLHQLGEGAVANQNGRIRFNIRKRYHNLPIRQPLQRNGIVLPLCEFGCVDGVKQTPKGFQRRRVCVHNHSKPDAIAGSLQYLRAARGTCSFFQSWDNLALVD